MLNDLQPWKQLMSNPISHAIQAISGALAFLVAQSLTFDAGWINAIEKLGLAAGLVVYFVYTGWKREKRMAKRIDQLENKSAKLSAELAKLTEQFNEAMRRDVETIADAVKVLSQRPCIAFKDHEAFHQWLAARDGL